MSRRSRRNHTPTFQAKVALAAVRGDKTLAELAKQFHVHSNQITDWKNQLLERAAGVFGEASGKAQPPVDLKVLHAKIGSVPAVAPHFAVNGEDMASRLSSWSVDEAS